MSHCGTAVPALDDRIIPTANSQPIVSRMSDHVDNGNDLLLADLLRMHIHQLPYMQNRG